MKFHVNIDDLHNGAYARLRVLHNLQFIEVLEFSKEKSENKVRCNNLVKRLT